MKNLTLITLLLSTTILYGQLDFSAPWENAQHLSVPYSSQNDNEIQNNKKVLTQNDSANLIAKLIAKKPRIVNHIVSSPFGHLDCASFEECFVIDNIHELALIGYIAVDSSNYLLCLKVIQQGYYTLSKVLLISMNIKGELNDWLIADNSTWGNQNGRLSRDFKIDTNFIITVSESSWGRNNLNYSLEVEYKVFNFTESKENEDDDKIDYDNSYLNKIEDFELDEGKFELIKLCLNI